MNRPDPRSPLVFDTRELSRRPGSMLERSRTLPAPEDLGTDVIAVPAGSPLELELRFESVVEGVLVSGSATATATGTCVRCLEPLRYPVSARFQELFAYVDRAAHHQEVGVDPDEDDVRELAGDLVDLEQVCRDAVVPSLPFKPVCRGDCPGLCSRCGLPLADDPGHQHEVADPRWAALSALAGQRGDYPRDPAQDHRSTPNNREKRN